MDSTENIPDATKPPVPGRLKRRFFIPAVIAGMVAILLLWGIVRGNWTDAQPRNPASAADGVMTQLLRTSEGRIQIHAAAVVSAPPADVWKVITNYNHFAEVFPNVASSKGTQDTNGLWRLTGEVRCFAGHWPMDLHVRHEETPGKFMASWDEPNGAWKINRGSWVIAPHGSGESLLEYNLELRVSPFPDFVVRTVLLDQLKPVLRAVASHAQKNQAVR